MSRENYLIRNANYDDLDSIKSVYNHFITDSFAAYTDTKIKIDTCKDWFQKAKIFKVIVFENTVVGFIQPYKPFNTFKHTGVLTYFLLPKFTGKGLGTKLFNTLVEEAKTLGITNLLAHISSRNLQSINFHKKMGFEECGRMKNMALKNDIYLDIIWVQKLMNGTI